MLRKPPVTARTSSLTAQQATASWQASELQRSHRKPFASFSLWASIKHPLWTTQFISQLPCAQTFPVSSSNTDLFPHTQHFHREEETEAEARDAERKHHEANNSQERCWRSPQPSTRKKGMSPVASEAHGAVPFTFPKGGWTSKKKVRLM